jgi:deazaflavin-dependent oxidoreductase (nitroreductase family)
MSKFDVDQGNRDLEAGKGPPEWVAEHLRVYRESGGAEGHLFDATIAGVPGLVPCLLLTTIGRRSGEKRTSPLFYGTAGDAYVIIGSKGGADTQPGWYQNLLANPTAEVQVGSTSPSARVWQRAKSVSNSGSRWRRWLLPIASTRRRLSARFP